MIDPVTQAWLAQKKASSQVLGRARPLPMVPVDLEQNRDLLDVPVVAHFGGGANSTAYILRWLELGRRLDLVLFADTAGEKPETYNHLVHFDVWLKKHGVPTGVTVVAYRDRQGDLVELEERCLTTERLPSLAYGFKKCSVRFKRDPQAKFLNNWPVSRPVWEQGRRCIALIGYDADEPHRMKKLVELEQKLVRAQRQHPDNPSAVRASMKRLYDDARRWVFRFPLLEEDWGREECEEACERLLGYVPAKSSCFFCPASKPAEIRALPPELQHRALAIESNAVSTAGHTPRLGRYFSWKGVLDGTERPVLNNDMPCECTD